MEAVAIPDEQDSPELENGDVVTFCDGIADSRILLAVAALAAGKSKKEAAAAAGVDRMTLWRWEQQYPIEQLAAAEAQARVRPALMKLSANLEAAAEVICQATRGEIEPEVVGEAGISYAKAQMRLKAAQATVGIVSKLIERAQDGESPGVTVMVTSKARELSPAELVQAAREVRRRRLGKGR